MLPESPKKQNITFQLFTTGSDVTAYSLNVSDNDSIRTSDFNSSRSTKIIVHGLAESAWKQWILDLKDAIIAKDDVNVIVVNWHDGAGTITNPFTYLQAVANTRVVGAVIAKLIHILKNVTGASFGGFHLIGYSLGGHVAGYAGERVKRLARITGLDPASWLFDGYGDRVGLDKSEADFVDVIHTDSSPIALGLGTLNTRGHADFYPNGGSQTEACGTKMAAVWKLFTWDFMGAVKSASCSHVMRAWYFVESVKGANYVAYPCASRYDFDDGRCTDCHCGCPRMGYYADRGEPRGSYYLHIVANNILRSLGRKPFQ